MAIIINPGSEIKGGTMEQAKKNASLWLTNIHNEGFEDITMSEGTLIDGRYTFQFKHSVTGVIVDLDIHGFTDQECEQFLFYPRIYWNGWSSEEPKIDDWLKDGYSYRIEFYKTKL